MLEIMAAETSKACENTQIVDFSRILIYNLLVYVLMKFRERTKNYLYLNLEDRRKENEKNLSA